MPDRITTATEMDALRERLYGVAARLYREASPTSHTPWVANLARDVADAALDTIASLIAEAEARGAREALTEASQLVDEAAWLTHPIDEASDYWTALDDVVKALNRLARGEGAGSCTCDHYVVDRSDPEPYHPENVDREDDPTCPIHGAANTRLTVEPERAEATRVTQGVFEAAVAEMSRVEKMHPRATLDALLFAALPALGLTHEHEGDDRD